MPFVLLLPDLLILLIQRVYYPSPVDVLMRYYKDNSGSTPPAIEDQPVRVRVTPTNSVVNGGGLNSSNKNTIMPRVSTLNNISTFSACQLILTLPIFNRLALLMLLNKIWVVPLMMRVVVIGERAFPLLVSTRAWYPHSSCKRSLLLQRAEGHS